MKDSGEMVLNWFFIIGKLISVPPSYLKSPRYLLISRTLIINRYFFSYTIDTKLITDKSKQRNDVIGVVFPREHLSIKPIKLVRR